MSHSENPPLDQIHPVQFSRKPEQAAPTDARQFWNQSMQWSTPMTVERACEFAEAYAADLRAQLEQAKEALTKAKTHLERAQLHSNPRYKSEEVIKALNIIEGGQS